MPHEVKIAVYLIYASLGVGIAKTLVNPKKPLSNAFVVSILVLVFGFLIWLAIKISAGRNWARITFLVFVALGIFPSLLYLPFEFAKSRIFFSLDVLQILLQGAASILPFVGSSAPYFRNPRSSA